MASEHHMLAILCLVIVCTARLSLTAPVDEEPTETKEEDGDVDAFTTTTKPVDKQETTDSTKTTNSVVQGNSSTTNGTSTIQKSSTEVLAPSGTTGGTTGNSSAATSSIPNPTTPEVKGTSKPDADKSTVQGENGPVRTAEPETWLPWSHSTWASVAVPVGVGLGSALFLIAWICCVRKTCNRRCGRWRSPPYKDRHRSNAGPAKKALREDFRQLRAKDRMKLLAESSDEEF